MNSEHSRKEFFKPSGIGRAIAVAVLAPPLLAACGAAGSGDGTALDPAYLDPAVVDASATSAALTANEQLVGGLAAARISRLGAVVTDDQGRVLYRFDKDSAKPPAATCLGRCARMWPPVLTDGAPVLDGVPPELVGSVVRPDSLRQVTLGGWPLYRYAGDTAPGQWKGQGRSGVWYVVSTTGRKNTRAVAEAGSAAAPSAVPGTGPTTGPTTGSGSTPTTAPNPTDEGVGDEYDGYSSATPGY